MRGMKRGLLFLVLLLGVVVHADVPTKQAVLTKLCEQLLESNFTPEGFANDPLFVEEAPGIFALVGSEILSERN